MAVKVQKITKLPTPPSTKDTLNFSERADAFVGALPTLCDEINQFGDDVANLAKNASDEIDDKVRATNIEIEQKQAEVIQANELSKQALNGLIDNFERTSLKTIELETNALLANAKHNLAVELLADNFKNEFVLKSDLEAKQSEFESRFWQDTFPSKEESQKGDIFRHSDTNVYYIYDGFEWVELEHKESKYSFDDTPSADATYTATKEPSKNPTYKGDFAPSDERAKDIQGFISARTGDTFKDTNTNELYIFDGLNWMKLAKNDIYSDLVTNKKYIFNGSEFVELVFGDICEFDGQKYYFNGDNFELLNSADNDFTREVKGLIDEKTKVAIEQINETTEQITNDLITAKSEMASSLNATQAELTKAVDSAKTSLTNSLNTARSELTTLVNNSTGSKIYIFKSSGTFTAPKTGNAFVICIGGGGGGGAPFGAYGGGGGGSGGKAINVISLTANSKYPYVVGAGGAGGTNVLLDNARIAEANGKNGGDSSFNNNLVATGGNGGGRAYESGGLGGAGGAGGAGGFNGGDGSANVSGVGGKVSQSYGNGGDSGATGKNGKNGNAGVVIIIV